MAGGAPQYVQTAVEVDIEANIPRRGSAQPRGNNASQRRVGRNVSSSLKLPSTAPTEGILEARAPRKTMLPTAKIPEARAPRKTMPTAPTWRTRASRAFAFLGASISQATPKGPQGVQIKDFLEGFGDDSTTAVVFNSMIRVQKDLEGKRGRVDSSAPSGDSDVLTTEGFAAWVKQFCYRQTTDGRASDERVVSLVVDCLMLTTTEEGSTAGSPQHSTFKSLSAISEDVQAAMQDHNPVEMEPNERSQAEQISAALLRVPEAPGHIRSTFEGAFTRESSTDSSDIAALKKAGYNALTAARSAAGKSKAKAPSRSSKKQTPGCVSRLGSRGSVLVWAIFAVAIPVARTLHFRYTVELEDGGEPSVVLSIAKGTGLGMTAGIVLLYATQLKMFAWWTTLSWVRRLVADVTIHATVGFIMTLLCVVHTIAHFARPWDWGGMHADRTKCRLFYTGVALLIVFLTMGMSATRRASHPAAYRIFSWLHNAHVLILPILLAHVPARWYVYGPLLILVLSNMLIKHRRTFVTNLGQNSCRLGSSTIISVDKFTMGSFSTNVPGSYYKINIPKISGLEWHPFSLSSSESSPRTEFIIKDSGVWTHALAQLLEERSPSELAQIEVKIQGPYWAEAVETQASSKMVLVAAGIGITPYLSVLHRIAHQAGEVAKQKRFSDLKKFIHSDDGAGWNVSTLSAKMAEIPSTLDQAVLGNSNMEETPEAFDKFERSWSRVVERCFTKQHATVIWVVRDLQLAEQFITCVVALAAFCSQHHYQVPFVVKLYFTSGGNLNLSQMLSNAMAAVEFNLLSAAAGGDALQVHFGRPDFEAELLQAGSVDTFYCGPPRFGEIVATACAKHLVALHPESFANGAYGNIWPRGPFGSKKKKKTTPTPKKMKLKETRPSGSLKKAHASISTMVDAFNPGGRLSRLSPQRLQRDSGQLVDTFSSRDAAKSTDPSRNPCGSFAPASMGAISESGEAGDDIDRLRIKEDQVSAAQRPALRPTSGVLKPPLMEHMTTTV